MKFNKLTFKKKILLITVFCIALFVSYRQLTYVPGYCSATKHLISDEEFIHKSIKFFEGEIKSRGGFDAYEKHLVEIRKHPEEAGRDFDKNDPDCCRVYRGEDNAKRSCGIGDYPICVILEFPEFKEPPKGYVYYKREGRTYLFDDCGKLQENY